MTVDFTTFLQKLSDSGILSAGEINALRDGQPGQPDDATHAARELVRKHKLTNYQFEILCEGSAEPLSIGDYLILDRIGEGGMGIVFRVRHRATQAIHACKILPAQLTDNETAVRRFQREIRTATRLSHPNIVATNDSGEVDGTHFLTMEYVEGYNLAAFVRKHGALPVWTVMDCVVPICRGVAYAHSQNVIHRDIKPSNVLIDGNGTVRVLDMGLARLLTDPDEGSTAETITDLTQHGSVLGTADYMAPEQALNAKNADERTDIYSLGCTLFFLLAGRTIYPGDTAMEKFVAHREHSLPSLIGLQDRVPPELDTLFQRLVAKSPEDRPQHMRHVLDELESIRNEHQYSWAMRRIVARRKERWPRSDI